MNTCPVKGCGKPATHNFGWSTAIGYFVIEGASGIYCLPHVQAIVQKQQLDFGGLTPAVRQPVQPRLF